jgi:tRNA G18 (ribose-2'-O)-methylase SpoU
MAGIVTITDADDPRLADYRDIRERDLVGRRGLFVAEGEVVVRLLLEKRPQDLVSVLLTPARLHAMQAVLQHIEEEYPIFVANSRILEELTGFSIHRGLLAIGKRSAAADRSSLLAALPVSALVLVGIGIANHDNMGGLFRNGAAFGIDAALFDATSCDPLYRKAIRVSVGSALITPFHRGGSGQDLLRDLTSAGFALLGLSPRGDHTVADVPLAERVALVMGAEGPGLTADLLAATTPVRIPMAGMIDSLNVATAAGIALARVHERRIGLC